MTEYELAKKAYELRGEGKQNVEISTTLYAFGFRTMRGSRHNPSQVSKLILKHFPKGRMRARLTRKQAVEAAKARLSQDADKINAIKSLAASDLADRNAIIRLLVSTL